MGRINTLTLRATYSYRASGMPHAYLSARPKQAKRISPAQRDPVYTGAATWRTIMLQKKGRSEGERLSRELTERPLAENQESWEIEKTGLVVSLATAIIAGIISGLVSGVLTHLTITLILN